MMSRTALAVLVLFALVGGTADAQEKPAPEQRKPSNSTPARPVEAAKVIRNVPNVQIEVTIADTIGSSAAQKKNVSMTVADGHMGRIRSARSQVSPTLNIDATPYIVDGSRVRLQLTLEYRAQTLDEKAPTSPINEMITVTLENGTPLVVSQAADPATDRRVTVEVRATILK
jgi:hypothetical protein